MWTNDQSSFSGQSAGEDGDEFLDGEAAEDNSDATAMPHNLLVGHQSSPPAQASTAPSSLSSDTEIFFPKKLFIMLHEAERDRFADVVSWGKDSVSNFKVHNKRDFEQFILPKYFKMTKYKSFTRQLHNYKFMWIRTGPDKGGCECTKRGSFSFVRFCVLWSWSRLSLIKFWVDHNTDHHPALDRNNPSCCYEIMRKVRTEDVESGTKIHTRSNATMLASPSDEDRKPSPYERLYSHDRIRGQDNVEAKKCPVDFSSRMSSRRSFGIDSPHRTVTASGGLEEQELKKQPIISVHYQSCYHDPLHGFLEPRTIEEMLKDVKHSTPPKKMLSKGDADFRNSRTP
jgi:hypothetical protein